MTTLNNPIPAGLAALNGALRQILNLLTASWSTPADAATLSARELHALADRYEASQPSFAADLRAAAGRQG